MFFSGLVFVLFHGVWFLSGGLSSDFLAELHCRTHCIVALLTAVAHWSQLVLPPPC